MKRESKKMRKFKKIFFIAIILGVVFVPVAMAQNDSLIGGQNPDKTLGEIFQPFKTFIEWMSGLIENIILRLFDWDWIRGIFVGLFGAIDRLVERITGNGLGDIFRIIGHALSEMFYFILNTIKSL